MATYPPVVPRGGKVGLEGGVARPVRNRRSELAIWWREIDRTLLFLILTLMAIGTAAVAASSPASARRLSTAAVRLDDLYFFTMHIRWQFVGLIAMIGASMLPKELARRGQSAEGVHSARPAEESGSPPPEPARASADTLRVTGESDLTERWELFDESESGLGAVVSGRPN
ncbi:MAG: hypothetical protein RL268_1758, partial [Pseudomonadota bacterium]